LNKNKKREQKVLPYFLPLVTWTKAKNRHRRTRAGEYNTHSEGMQKFGAVDPLVRNRRSQPNFPSFFQDMN